ncbi:MAG: sugar transferase [Candidatus Omnitrophota bacterium]|jgi:exopolysaccharide biosynthesis polyprenyl glycosylphosphotransferase
MVTVAFFLGYFFRSQISGLYPLSAYIGLLPILLIIWLGLLYSFGMYKSFRTKEAVDIVIIVFKATFLGFIIFATYTYLFKLDYISRAFIAFVFIFSAILITFEKIILILFTRYIRKKGYNFRCVLIVGTGERAQYFIDLIREHAEWGLKIVGLIDEDIDKIGKVICGCEVIGSFKNMPDIIHNNIIDEVVFVVPRSWLNKIEEIMHFCETEGLKVSVAVDYFKLKLSQGKQEELGGFPLLTFESTSDKLWQLLFKRLLDLIFCIVALVLLIPVFIIVSIIIKVTSEGPVFFRQERCGLNGRKFTLYKFRTMIRDAEDKLDSLMEHNEMKGPVFKIENDPRLTKVGKFLRKSSIDELPQLWNVLMGDMSVVGPRPPIPAEVKKYDNWQRRRLSMRPGITCFWQINGRNKIVDFNEWMRLDLEYIDNWSLWLDFKILFKTVPVVLFGIGAK